MYRNFYYSVDNAANAPLDARSNLCEPVKQ